VVLNWPCRERTCAPATQPALTSNSEAAHAHGAPFQPLSDPIPNQALLSPWS
jgi:hypothetical protein